MVNVIQPSGICKSNNIKDPSDFSAYPALNQLYSNPSLLTQNAQDSFTLSTTPDSKGNLMKKVATGIAVVVGAVVAFKIGKFGFNLVKGAHEGVSKVGGFFKKRA